MRYRTNQQSYCPYITCADYYKPELANPIGNARHQVNNHSVLWHTPGGYRSFSEIIADEPSAHVSGFKSCSHTREVNNFSADPVNHTYVLSGAGNYACKNVTTTDVEAAFDASIVPDIDMDAYAEQAMAFMYPRINEGTSLVNFILELKDLKAMNPKASLDRMIKGRHKRVGPELLIQLGQRKQSKAQFTQELAHRLASGHLTATFGIVPLVGDVVKCWDELKDLEHKLDVLYKYAGRRQARHYRRVLPPGDGSGKLAPVSTWSDWSERMVPSLAAWDSLASDWNASPAFTRPAVRVVSRSRWMTRPTYHATCRFKYTLPVRDAQAEVRAKLEVLGVKLDPSIIWNALPFSFLVDWVVDVSSFLKQFSVDTFPINTRVTQFCHSVVWEKCAEIEVRYIDNSVWWNKTPAGSASPVDTTERRIQCYDGRRRSYTRIARPVPAMQSVQARAPRLREAALAGSLLVTNTKLLNKGKEYQYWIPDLGNPRKNARQLRIL